MADPNPNTTPAPEPTPPSMADLQAIAKSAQEAAAEARSAADAATAAKGAASQEADKRGLGDIPQEVLDQIGTAAAAATVAELRQEFELNQPDPTPAGGGAAGASPPSSAGSAPGLADTPAPTDEPPPRKTIAQRILGY